MFGLTGQEMAWILVAIVAVIVILVALRFFMGIAVELMRVGVVVIVLLAIGAVVWWLFFR